MSAASSRLDRLRGALAERELDAALISAPANLRYLTGYVGSNALALVWDGGATLLTDGRYAVSARRQVSDADVVIGKRDLLGDAAGFLVKILYWTAHASLALNWSACAAGSEAASGVKCRSSRAGFLN